MEKKKKGKKKRRKKTEVPSTGIDSLMVSPPTLQRHELGKSIHATFLYPTSILPADARNIRTSIWYWYLCTWYHEVGSLNEAIHKQSNTSSRQYR